jgi:hypothetical protein
MIAIMPDGGAITMRDRGLARVSRESVSAAAQFPFVVQFN